MTIACLVLAPAPAGAADTCPNAAVRAQQHATGLPDCRAYEKVSPLDKGDGDIWFQHSTVRSSADGTRVVYQAPTAVDGDESAMLPVQRLSTLTDEGWTSKSIMPPYQDLGGVGFDFRFGYQDFASDLTSGVLLQAGPQLAPDAPTGIRNLYRRTFESGAYGLLTPAPVDPILPLVSWVFPPVAFGSTDDLGHVVFESSQRLLPGAPPLTANCTNPIFPSDCIPEAYEIAAGQLRQVGILPDGTPAPGGAVAGRGAGTTVVQQQPEDGAISDDGSRIFFTTPASVSIDGARGDLYVRENGSSTRPVSVSKRAVPDPAGRQPASFRGASDDGSVALFASCEKLTDDSTADAGGATDCAPGAMGVKVDLYRYDLEGDVLIDLSASVGSVEGVIGFDKASANSVYFGTQGSTIYHWRDGVASQVATVDTSEHFDLWPSNAARAKQASVSGDGRFLAFSTIRSQAGFDTGGRRQIFVYDAETRALNCISCQSGGETPSGDAILRPTDVGVSTFRPYRSNNIDDRGNRLFFETPESLVRDDTNGRVDVYQYNLRQGDLALLSPGKSGSDAHFGDASPDGDSIFFVTREPVIPDLDDDELADVYVARAGAAPRVAGRVAECEGDACQGGVAARLRQEAPGSAALAGPGDELERPRSSTAMRVAKLSTVRGSSGTVRVRVPGKGRIRASGPGLSLSTKTARKPGTYRLKVALSKRSRRALRRDRRVTVRMTVRFTSSEGKAQSVRLTVTFKRKDHQS